MAKFEWLPNEILLESFKYLDDVQLFCAYYSLNFRLDTLLSIHFQSYHFDFRSISKQKFHLICQQHLPYIIEQVKSLYLSNDDETPNLPEIFYSYNFTLNKFSYLQYLSIDSIHCLSTLNRITFECRTIPYLTHLYLIKCDFKDQMKFSHLIENIWSLSKLILCQIDHRFPYELKFTNNSIISSTIKYLFVQNFQFNSNDLRNLFQSTPSLEQFHASIIQHNEYEQFHINSSSVCSLNISFRKPFDSMLNFFKNFSNLNRLTIKTHYLYLNGNEWKKIIKNYLSKLEIFQLKMDLKFSHPKHIEEQLNELLNSFRTSFWIKEHQWFVQCDWFLLGITNYAVLYTLPYVFQEFILTNKQWSKSTLIDNDQYQIYDHITNLTVMNVDTIPYFRNVQHLKINLPLTNHFWSSIKSFDRLISLEIIFFQGCFSIPLQILLDQSPRLHSLCFGNFSDLEILTKLTSKSIVRLDFLKKNTYKKYFNNTQCSLLIRSPLGYQCKTLLIYLENRMNIIQLIKNMNNLQSIICQCKDDKLNDDFIQWLYRHLPSTYSISRDLNQLSNIRIWIG
ncbi:unnamed protein product [Adineta steineri]|uniref:F-box domain-containing protein n=1 Tax=Adineta steineri TaxID=433720 RepID=A0A819Q541_9BILA|nr:unnamed protein product [Adineta steineri]CAF4022931.1 unnamed protein product [Adineta steineri]